MGTPSDPCCVHILLIWTLYLILENSESTGMSVPKSEIHVVGNRFFFVVWEFSNWRLFADLGIKYEILSTHCQIGCTQNPTLSGCGKGFIYLYMISMGYMLVWL